MSARRRAWLRGLSALTGALVTRLSIAADDGTAANSVPDRPHQYPEVTPGRRLRFPDDHGAHPDFRTEWWYLTAWLDSALGPIGWQLTFFRSRTRHTDQNPSRFAPRQLMFAHAALALPDNQKLIHAQLAARVDRPMYSQTDTALTMRSRFGPWQLTRSPQDHYVATAKSAEFDFELRLRAAYAPVLQGDGGYSRKGEQPQQASYYYSRPQLGVSGNLRIGNQQLAVSTGRGWLDHEWSSEMLDPNAIGWDWAGLNLDNGDALMVFQIRSASGTIVNSHARWVRDGKPQPTAPPLLQALRHWRSPRTNASYPVAMGLRIGSWQARLEPLMDNQEMDTSRSTGTIYWEGAVRVIDERTGRQIGRGYLELTGYAGPIRF